MIIVLLLRSAALCLHNGRWLPVHFGLQDEHFMVTAVRRDLELLPSLLK